MEQEDLAAHVRELLVAQLGNQLLQLCETAARLRMAEAQLAQERAKLTAALSERVNESRL